MENLVQQLKVQIIEILNLEDVTPDDVDPAAALFGAGLGLDSIDALELVVMLERNHGILIEDIEIGRRALSSINAMAAFITERQGESSPGQ